MKNPKFLALLLPTLILGSIIITSFIPSPFSSTLNDDPIAFPKLLPTDSVGTLHGSFSVDGNGAANYSIPIEVPPGINGVQPQLSIAYSSQKKNGILGVGWSLSGLSSIRRVGRNIATDGTRGSVNLNQLDRFAIDGMRLIAYKDKAGNILDSQQKRDAAYGRDGTEYRTQIDKGTRIFSRGDCDTGNCYFETIAKNGVRSKYLDPANYSKMDHLMLYKNIGIEQLSQQNKSLEWKVISIIDLNRLEVFVEYEMKGNHPYPSKIVYGIRDDKQHANNLANGISFQWEDRPDPIISYSAGRRLESTARLKAITTSTFFHMVRKYYFEYTKSLVTGESLLKSVKVCDHEDNCLPPTIFEYEGNKSWDGTFDIQTPGKNEAGDPYQDFLRDYTLLNPRLLLTGDYDGDGKTDFLAQSSKSNSSPYTPQNLNDPLSIYFDYRDQPSAVIAQTFRHTSINASPITSAPNWNHENIKLFPTDVNGDGMTDFLCQNAGPSADINANNFSVYFSQGPDLRYRRGKFKNFLAFQPNGGRYQKWLQAAQDRGVDMFLGDFNGDGRGDFFTRDYGTWGNSLVNTNFVVYLSNGDGTYEVITPEGAVSGGIYNDRLRRSGDYYNKIVPGDFNGDGMTDFLSQPCKYSSDPFAVYLSKGDGTFHYVTNILPNPDMPSFRWKIHASSPQENSIITPGDFNGDGMTDFAIQAYGSNNTFVLFFSKGDGTFEMVKKEGAAYQVNLDPTQGAYIIPADFNGDGATDFIRQEHGDWAKDSDYNNSFQIYISQRDGTFKVITPGENKWSDPYQGYLRADQGAHIIPGDYDGDGLTDFIRQETGNNAGDYNNSFSLYLTRGDNSYPKIGNHRLSSITNGIGKITSISYDLITDSEHQLGNTAFPYYPGRDELKYPYRHTQPPLWVVSGHNIKESKQYPSILYYTHEYKDAQLNNERGWLGFRTTILSDHQKKIKTITTHSNRFPFLGHIEERTMLSTEDNFDTLGRVITTYDKMELGHTGIYRVFKTSYTLRHFTEGTFNYALQKKYHYDYSKLNLVKLENLGDLTTDLDDVYTFFSYPPQEEDAFWKYHYPIGKKQCQKNEVLWDNWDANNDLEWEIYDYDNQMNRTSHTTYLDDCGQQPGSPFPCQEVHLTTHVEYNEYGSPTKITAPDGSFQRMTYFTPNYPSYISSVQHYGIGSDSLVNGVHHKETFKWDPRFGILLRHTHIDGNAIINIPDNGIDGLGRILKTEEQHPTQDETILMTQTFLDKKQDGGMIVKTYHRKDWLSSSDTSQWLRREEYYDAFARKYRTEEKGYNKDTKLVNRLRFNDDGQVVSNYLPYFENKKHGAHYHPDDRNYSHTPDWYFTRNYTSHGRLHQIGVTYPSRRYGQTYITSEVDYQLHNDRRIWYKTPHPNDDDKMTWHLQKKDTYGRTIEKAGPFAVQNENAQLTYPEDKSLRLDSKTIYKYDKQGRLVKTIDPLGQTSTSTYNSRGQLIREYKPETGTKYYQYNNNGLLVWTKDSEGNQQQFKLDGLSRIIERKSINANGEVEDKITYSYDVCKGQKDNNCLGRLVKVSSSNSEYAFQYDKRGNIFEKTTKLNDFPQFSFIFRYLYDPLDRQRQITYPDKTLVRYNYDHYDGTLSTIQQAQGVSDKFSGYDFKTIAAYDKYNADGSIGRISYANGDTTIYDYDYLGRLSSTKTWRKAYTHRHLNYVWNHANKLVKISDMRKEKEGGDQSQHFEYDVAGRLHKSVATASIKNEQSFKKGDQETNTYYYDPAGNIASYTIDNPHYQYTHKFTANPKALHQLNHYHGKEVNKSASANEQYPDADMDISYDKNGNLTGGASDYSYNANALLDTVSYQPLVGQNFKALLNSFEYDAYNRRIKKTAYNYNNNFSTRPHEGYTWYISELFEIQIDDKLNIAQTRYVGGPNGIISLQNNPFKGVDLLKENELLGLNLYESGSFIPPVVVYNYLLQTLLWGSLIVLLLWIISIYIRKPFYTLINPLKHGLQFSASEQRHFQKTWLGRQRLSRVIYGLMVWSFTVVSVLPASAQEAPEKTPFGTYYLHLDHIGSTALVTDQTGGFASTYRYSAFGEQADEAQVNGDNKVNARPTFTGKEYDRATNLYYFGARYYDANLSKRFISPDPAQQYHSPYIYGFDDPTSGTDPDGQFFGLLTALIVGAVIGAYVGGAIANHSFNPASWDWSAGSTWAGIFTGAIAGAALAAGGAAGLAEVGLIAAETASIGGISAGTIASVSADLAFLAYDGYTFATHPNAENGIFLALDMIPFVGPLIGKAASGASKIARGLSRGEHELSAAAHSAEEAATHPAEMEHLSCPLSFAADTEIITREGQKAIQDIEVGDEVLGYNETTATTAYYPVSSIFNRIAPEKVNIVLEEDTIITTTEHPFYVVGEGWIEAQHLKVGSPLLDQNGAPSLVLNIWIEEVPIQVYNFEVVGVHNYFVSEEGVLVHNAKHCMHKSSTTVNKHSKTKNKRVTVQADVNTKGSSTGTGTSQGTRNYVNNAKQIAPPKRYKLQVYLPDGTKIGTGWVHNPSPASTGHSAYDAGHMFANKAMGGPGNQNLFVFPQNPAINRGNQGTYSLWKQIERAAGIQIDAQGSAKLVFKMEY